MAKFEHSWRKTIFPFLLLSNGLNALVITIKMSSSMNKDKQAQTVWFAEFGSYTLSTVLISVVAAFKLQIIDFMSLFILLVRVTVTFWLYHLATTGVQGFEEVDLKELYAQIPYIGMPYFFFAFVNWKFNLAVTVPVTLVSCVVATQLALTTKDDNMSCFAEPAVFTSSVVIGQQINMIVPLACAYWVRLISLERFLDHHNSLSEQHQLQTLFDNQLDGVIIFSRSQIPSSELQPQPGKQSTTS